MFSSEKNIMLNLLINNFTNYEINLESPNEWIKWECGKESSLKEKLEKIDILILNHGIYDLSRENTNYENLFKLFGISSNQAK